MEKGKWTKEPWKVSKNGSYGPWVGSCNALDPEYGAASHDVGVERHEIATPHGNNRFNNAARIVSCVNGCAGLDPAAYRGLIEAAEALEAKLDRKESKSGKGDDCQWATIDRRDATAKNLRAAIARATGKGE